MDSNVVWVRSNKEPIFSSNGGGEVGEEEDEEEVEKRQVVVVVVVVLVRVGRGENRSGDLRVDDHDGWAVRVSLVGGVEKVLLLILVVVGRTRRGRTPPVFQADTPTRRRIPNVVIVVVVVCETVRTNHPKKNQRQQDRKVNQGIRRIVSAFCCFRFRFVGG